MRGISSFCPSAAPISEPVCITANQRRPYRIADITDMGVVRLGYFAIHAAL